MTPLSTSQRAGLFAFASLATCLLCAWLLFGRGTSPLQTDVLTLLPATERHPLAEDAVERLARASGDRMVLLVHDKDDDAEWLHSSAVKTHMRRMDPSFSEKALGYRSFSDFVKARESIAELEETGHERLVRLRE